MDPDPIPVLSFVETAFELLAWLWVVPVIAIVWVATKYAMSVSQGWHRRADLYAFDGPRAHLAWNEDEPLVEHPRVMPRRHT